MDIEEIKRQLEVHGWCIIPDILTMEEVEEAKRLFYEWQKTPTMKKCTTPSILLEFYFTKRVTRNTPGISEQTPKSKKFLNNCAHRRSGRFI